MAKLDYKKEYKELYSGKQNIPIIVDVPQFNYLMVDGKGNPNSSEDFTNAIEALYGTAYTLKFMIKNKNPNKDYTVMPLEAQWYADDMDVFKSGDKDSWKWTLMILQPEFVSEEEVSEAVNIIKEKKNLPALSGVRLEKVAAHKSGQILHIGPYENEAPTIEILHKHITDNGFELTGRHLEIYLSDPRRTAPEKLKTIIRQPFK